MITYGVKPWGYQSVTATEGAIRTMLVNQSEAFIEWLIVNQWISHYVHGPFMANGLPSAVSIFDYVREMKGEDYCQALYDKCYPKNDSPLSTQSNSSLIFSNKLLTATSSSSTGASPVANLTNDVLLSPDDPEMPKDRKSTQPPIGTRRQ